MTAVSPTFRYFEDFAVGATWEHEGFTLDEAEIIEFARRYDPQPMHTDPGSESAAAMGGLIASGWQTAALSMRMLGEMILTHSSSYGSPGVEDLKWLKPVRPGDRIRVRVAVTETRLLQSRPDRGMVRIELETLNQNNDVVMTLKSGGFFGRRP